MTVDVRETSRRWRTALYVILVSLVASISSILICEALLRYGFAPNISFERNKVYGQSQATKRKLLFVGDSFMALDHVGRDCFLMIVDALRGSGLSMVNAAVPNTGPIDYLSQMKIQYQRQGYDGAYLFFYVGNDLTDTVNHNMYNATTGTRLKGLVRDAVRGLYIYNFYLQKRNQLGWSTASAAAPPLGDIAVDERLLKAHKEGRVPEHHLWTASNNTQPNFYLENLLIESVQSQEGWRRIEALLDGMRDASMAHGAKLSIVVFPAALQVSKSDFAFAEMIGMRTSEETLTGNEPQRRLLEYCASRKIACLDLLPVFRKHRDKRLYLEYDDHLSLAGNKLAAQAISEFIVANEK